MLLMNPYITPRLFKNIVLCKLLLRKHCGFVNTINVNQYAMNQLESHIQISEIV